MQGDDNENGCDTHTHTYIECLKIHTGYYQRHDNNINLKIWICFTSLHSLCLSLSCQSIARYNGHIHMMLCHLADGNLRAIII